MSRGLIESWSRYLVIWRLVSYPQKHTQLLLRYALMSTDRASLSQWAQSFTEFFLFLQFACPLFIHTTYFQTALILHFHPYDSSTPTRHPPLYIILHLHIFNPVSFSP